MTIKSTTLRPGYLVSLKTSVRGGVSYDKRVIESARTNEEGVQQSRWETEKTVVDPAENEAARKVRGVAGALISAACVRSAFGLLCPDNNSEALEASISEARRLVADFNAAANITRISIYVITGRIAPNDVEAVRAINSEIADLMATMQKGIETLDVKSTRDAASRLREVGGMLSPNAEGMVKVAIDVARQTARKIAAVGDGAAQEVDRTAVRKIAEQRTAFLDMDEAAEVAAPAATARALDIGPVQLGESATGPAEMSEGRKISSSARAAVAEQRALDLE